MLDQKSLVVGLAVATALAIATIWAAVMWQPDTPHSELYDQCLAGGHSTKACDAAMRALTSEREKARSELRCLTQARNGNPFDKIGCEDEATVR